jgi:hypothetical protein
VPTVKYRSRRGGCGRCFAVAKQPSVPSRAQSRTPSNARHPSNACGSVVGRPIRRGDLLQIHFSHVLRPFNEKDAWTLDDVLASAENGLAMGRDFEGGTPTFAAA